MVTLFFSVVFCRSPWYIGLIIAATSWPRIYFEASGSTSGESALSCWVHYILLEEKKTCTLRLVGFETIPRRIYKSAAAIFFRLSILSCGFKLESTIRRPAQPIHKKLLLESTALRERERAAKCCFESKKKKKKNCCACDWMGIFCSEKLKERHY